MNESNKIIIQESDFKMISSIPNNKYMFDLYLLQKIKGKDGDRYELKLDGYGLTVPSCIKRIAKYRYNNNFDKTEYNSLSEFINEYKQYKESIEKILNL